MAQRESMSFREFRERFQTEKDCREYLFHLRWPKGFKCPKCQREGAGCYEIRGRNEYVCRHCHRQTSVTSGTVMHRTHLPLTVWFWAIYLVAKDKRGISAVQLARELEIPYSSAWYLLHRLRSAMGQRDKDYLLSGIVELDDAYFGAPTANGERGRGTGKTSALVAVSLGETGHPRFLKLNVSELKTADVKTFAKNAIQSGTVIHSDALSSFRAALKDSYSHEYQVFAKNSGALRWVHTLISNVKAFLQGTYHGLSKKHLQRYFDEFAFRFNRRFWPDQLFPRLLAAVAASHILGYVDLTR